MLKKVYEFEQFDSSMSGMLFEPRKSRLLAEFKEKLTFVEANQENNAC